MLLPLMLPLKPLNGPSTTLNDPERFPNDFQAIDERCLNKLERSANDFQIIPKHLLKDPSTIHLDLKDHDQIFRCGSFFEAELLDTV